MRFRFLISFLALSFALAGCTKYMPKLDEVLPDKRTEYRKSKSMPDLEVPPDLTTDAIQDRMAIPDGGEVASYSSYQERLAKRREQKEVQAAGEAAIQKLENEYLLAVSGAPGLVWPKLREFWGAQGYELELDDSELGVMETAWLENGETLTRDKFKVFSEPGDEPTTTLLYVSHLGEELVPQGENLVWAARKRDEALEEKVVGDLRTSFGGAAPDTAPQRQVAATPAAPTEVDRSNARTAISGGGERAEIVSAGDGKLYIALDSDFEDSWKATGKALQSAGAVVDGADVERGMYSVRWLDENAAKKKKKGVFNKLAFWKGGAEEQEYRLSLTAVGEKTELVVLDKEGRWDTSDGAGKLLSQLHARLNEGA